MAPQKIEDLASFPASPGDLSQIFFGVDHLTNNISYRYSITELIGDVQENTALTQLNNVSAASAIAGQWLQFNGSQWVNASLPLANGSQNGLLAIADFNKLQLITVTQAIDLDAAALDISQHQTLFGRPDGSTDLGTFTGSIITDSVDIKVALQELETAIESLPPSATNLNWIAAPGNGTVTSDTGTNATLTLVTTVNAGLMPPGDKTKVDFLTVTQDVNLDTMESDISTLQTNQAAISLDVSQHQTLLGRPDGSTHLGTFTGTTITDNVDIKVALQELETAVEGVSGGTTNLGWTPSPTNGIVTNDNGNDATLTLVTSVNAGLMPPADKDKVDFITITQAVDLDVMESNQVTLQANQALLIADVLDLQTLTGRPDNSTHLGTFTGTTITDNVDIKVALQELETAVEAAGGVTNLGWTPSPTNGIVTSDTGTDATLTLVTVTNAGLMPPGDKTKVDFITVTQAADLDAMLLDISQHQTLLGRPDGSTHLGTFTGTTITDNVDVKVALQELETALEANSGTLFFNTFSALQSATGYADNTPAFLLGRYTVGDGGAPTAPYLYQSTGRPATDDGHSVAAGGADDWWKLPRQETFQAADFGASPSATAAQNAAAIQAAIDAANATGQGGIVKLDAGYTYNINLKLTFYEKVIIDGNNCEILQEADGFPIFELSDAVSNPGWWKIENMHLRYVNQQDSDDSDSACIRVSRPGVVSNRFTVRNVQVAYGYRGIDMPAGGASSTPSAFLCEFDNVHAQQCYEYGFHLVGGDDGARTNILLNRCYASQILGLENEESRAVYIKNCNNFKIIDLACDRIHNLPVVRIASCIGEVDGVGIEGCDWTWTSVTYPNGPIDSRIGVIQSEGSQVEINNVYAVGNSATLEGFETPFGLFRQSGRSTVRVGSLKENNWTITDNTTGSGGGFFHFTPDVENSEEEEFHLLKYKLGARTIGGSDPAFQKKEWTDRWAAHTWDGVQNVKRVPGVGTTVNWHVYYLNGTPASGTWNANDIIWPYDPSNASFKKHRTHLLYDGSAWGWRPINRDAGADDLGTGGNISIDFDAGDYNHKEYVANADAQITITEPDNEGEEHRLTISATGATRQLTWAGFVSLAGDSVLPSYVLAGAANALEIRFRKEGSALRVSKIETVEQTVDATTLSGSWTPDYGYVYDRLLVTNAVPAGVTLEPPAKMPIGGHMIIEFQTSTANVPALGAGFSAYGDAPTHNGKAVYFIDRTSISYNICRADAA